MKKFNTLRIKCNTNPDWNGAWLRHDVKNDMNELSIRYDLGEWPYIFDHVFDSLSDNTYIESIANMFESGVVVDITMNINGHTVRILQF